MRAFPIPGAPAVLLAALFALAGPPPAAAHYPVGEGPDVQVNTYTTSRQGLSDVAVLANGEFVVVWEGRSASDPDYGIQGQRYTASGTPVGGELQVNSYTTGTQRFPAVAPMSDGDFLVVWSSLGGSGTDTSLFSIQSRRFASDGTPQTGEVQINSFTTSDQTLPSIDVAADGDYVVAWQSQGSASEADWSIQAQRHAATGALQGAEFQVNSYTTGNQQYPSVDVDPTGAFTIAWTSAGSPESDDVGNSVQARRYDASGAAQGDQFQVNTIFLGNQQFPSVGSDANGDFVVMWSSDAIVHGQRFASDGSPIGFEFQVQGVGANPTAEVKPAGEFVVFWASSFTYGNDSSGTSIQGQLFGADGDARGSVFQVNSYITGFQDIPRAAIDASGRFIVTWESNGASPGSDNSSWSIQLRRMTDISQGDQFQVNTYTLYTQYHASVAMEDDGDFIAVWESAGSAGTDTSDFSIQGRRYASSGTPLGSDFQVNSYITSRQSNPSVGIDASGNFVVVWESYGSNGDPNWGIHMRRYDSGGAPQPQIQVNSFTTGTQSTPAVAIGDAGDFVVVWSSNGSPGTDTSGNSIQGQRYAANGATQGTQFQVNTYITGSQSFPGVAKEGDGDFVVAWQSAGSSGGDTSSSSIQAQRYAANGTPQGAQFQVNTYITSSQSTPALDIESDGDFVIAWDSNGSPGTDTSLGSIQARRYASNGSALGGQFQVNTYTTDGQLFSTVAVDPLDGAFVIGWLDLGSPGRDLASSIQVQRYASNGAPIGTQMEVNDFISGNQQSPAVAATTGSFVVVWESQGSFEDDDSIYSIQGQRYLPEPGSEAGLAAGLLLLAALRARRRVRASTAWCPGQGSNLRPPA